MVSGSRIAITCHNVTVDRCTMSEVKGDAGDTSTLAGGYEETE
jgi:hypothetical protein